MRSKLQAAIRAQRESWDAALGVEEITGYAGDIYAFVAETAGALDDDEAIPDDLVHDYVQITPRANLRETTSAMNRLKPNRGHTQRGYIAMIETKKWRRHKWLSANE